MTTNYEVTNARNNKKAMNYQMDLSFNYQRRQFIRPA